MHDKIARARGREARCGAGKSFRRSVCDAHSAAARNPRKLFRFHRPRPRRMRERLRKQARRRRYSRRAQRGRRQAHRGVQSLVARGSENDRLRPREREILSLRSLHGKRIAAVLLRGRKRNFLLLRAVCPAGAVYPFRPRRRGFGKCGR